MKNQSLLLSAAIVIIAVAACTKQKGVPVTTPDPNDVVDSTRLQNVTYQGDIKPILTTYCYGKDGQGCHITSTNTGANGDFTTYEGLKDKVDNGTIESRVFNQTSAPMPPTYSTSPTKLTATDMAIFKKWVAIGAPNN